MYKRKNSLQGIAMILVIVTLSMLILIAVPFSTSMRVEKRVVGSSLAKARAKLAAHGAFHYVLSKLTMTLDTMERYARQDKKYKTPHFDSLSELEVAIKLPHINTNNPRGEIWSASVEDEQGKININSATPWLLGNVLASAVVIELAGKSDTVIQVDSAINFPKTGGHLWVNGELISYQSIENDSSFVGCQRGLFSNTPTFAFFPPKKIRKGTLIVDARAYGICKHRTLYGPFRTVEEIKRIADNFSYAISADEFARISPALTVHSKRDGNWVHRQSILRDLPGTNPQKPDTVRITDTSFYGTGMMVKITQGNTGELAIIIGVSNGRITLDRRLTNTFETGKAFVSAMQPHPININTASPKVLFANTLGIRSGRNKCIQTQEAGELTTAILKYREEKEAFHSLEDYVKFLEAFRSNQLQNNAEKPLSKTKIHMILCSALSTIGERSRYNGVLGITGKSSGYARPFPTLAPITFVTGDVYTIKATAIINNSSGIPLAKHTIKKTVAVALSGPQRWSIETQNEFDNYVTRLPSSRVITWPNLPRRFDIHPQIAPDQQTGLTVDTTPLYPLQPQGSRRIVYQGFDDTHEGVVVRAATSPITLPRVGRKLAPASISLWFRPIGASGSGNFTLFNSGSTGSDNRLTCFYQGGNLFFQMFDNTLENSCNEIIAPLPLSNRWVHIMAAWFNSGELALWVDGKPRGEFRQRHETLPVKAVTSANISPNDTTIAISNSSGFPRQGVIRIGSEFIEYSSVSGGALTVRDSFQGFNLSNKLARGARGTAALQHNKGTPVSVLGYSDPLSSDVFPSTKLTAQVPDEALFTRLSSDIVATDLLIPVDSKKDFQPSGFLLIADELSNATEKVRYDVIQGSGFAKCQRGQLGTQARDFLQGAFVFPISIMVDDHSDYPNRGLVQLEDEWLQYDSKADLNFLVYRMVRNTIDAVKTTGKLNSLARGANNTFSATHADGTKVIPVFRVRFGFPGRFDKVTIINRDNPVQREEKEVNWADGTFVAFTKDVSRKYRRGGATRLLKFPTGELPHSNATSCTLGGGQSFFMDELLFLREQTPRNYLLIGSMDESETDIPINTKKGLSADGGLIKINDEYISYTGFAGKKLKGVQRGALNSTALAQTVGVPFQPIFFVPMSTLSSDVSLSATNISIKRANDFPAEGYVLCNKEVIGYSRRAGGSLTMPASFGGKKGGLRGAFGTFAQNHATDSLVMLMPTRYWDREIPEYEGPEQAYFETSKTISGALWENITWKENMPSNFLDIKILARVDGQPSWDTTPYNTPGNLYVFNDPQSANALNVRGDTLEIRVFFTYKQGAFDQGAWKDQAKLKSLYVAYRQPIRIFKSE